MSFFENLKMALASIASNKMRSLLTMLGIIIGISAVITITTLGNTLKSTFNNAMSLSGSSNLMAVGLEPKDGDYDVDIDLSDYITMDMIKEFMETYPGEYYFGSEASAGEGNLINSQKKSVNVSVIGGAEGTFDYNSIKMLYGRKVSFRDSLEGRHTCVVSDVFVEQYFKNKEEPIGQTISVTVNESLPVDFTIIGVYKYNEMMMGGGGNGNREELKTNMYIPYTVATEINDRNLNDFFYTAIFSYDNSLSAEEAISKMEDFFAEKYEYNKTWGARVYTNEQMMKVMSTAINIVTVIISVIAALSLIVGGVGVMNIMLVSVTERTREIGIRKALGAKKKTIKGQFVTEAIIICLIGGIIGILIGLLNGEIVAIIANKVVASQPDYADLLGNVSISPSIGGIIISLIFSTLTGVFFGLYPAGKAAKMNPIDALRYD